MKFETKVSYFIINLTNTLEENGIIRKDQKISLQTQFKEYIYQPEKQHFTPEELAKHQDKIDKMNMRGRWGPYGKKW